MRERSVQFAPWVLRLFGRPVVASQKVAGSFVVAGRGRRFAVRKHGRDGVYLRLVLECPTCGRSHLERQHMIRTRRDVRGALGVDTAQPCPDCAAAVVS